MEEALDISDLAIGINMDQEKETFTGSSSKLRNHG